MKILIGEADTTNRKGRFVGQDAYINDYHKAYICKAEKVLFGGEYPVPQIVEKVITVAYDNDKHGSPSQWKRHGFNHRVNEDNYDIRDENRRYWFIELDEQQSIRAINTLTKECNYEGESVVISVSEQFGTLAFYKNCLDGMLGATWFTMIEGLWQWRDDE